MGAYAVPVLVAVASIALMYVCCWRPIRRHARGESSACCAPSSSDASTANEIAALSAEIEALRQSMADPADAGHSRAASQADIPN